jgi:hypothetical protein
MPPVSPSTAHLPRQLPLPFRRDPFTPAGSLVKEAVREIKRRSGYLRNRR